MRADQVVMRLAAKKHAATAMICATTMQAFSSTGGVLMFLRWLTSEAKHSGGKIESGTTLIFSMRRQININAFPSVSPCGEEREELDR